MSKFNKKVLDMEKPPSGSRGETWLYDEIIELMRLWGDDSVQYALDQSHRNNYVYYCISTKLKEKGINRSTAECRGKAKSMKARYKVEREEVRKHGTTKWGFYEMMDRILGNKIDHPKGYRSETAPSKGNGPPKTPSILAQKMLDVLREDKEAAMANTVSASTGEVSASDLSAANFVYNMDPLPSEQINIKQEQMYDEDEDEQDGSGFNSPLADHLEMSAEDSQDGINQEHESNLSANQEEEDHAHTSTGVTDKGTGGHTSPELGNVGTSDKRAKSSRSTEKGSPVAKPQNESDSLSDMLASLSDSRKRKLDHMKNDLGSHKGDSDVSSIPLYKNLPTQQQLQSSGASTLYPKRLITNSYVSSMNGAASEYETNPKRQKFAGDYEELIGARQLECLNLDKELKTLQKVKYEIEIETLKKIERENLELKKLEKVRMSLEIDKLRLEKEKLEMEVNKIRCENVSAM